MPECLERRVKEHPRAAVTHHFPDFLPHFRTITMYAAFPARLFTVTERTTVQPCLRISQKVFAFGTKPFRPMPATAVQPYHKLHRILFFPYLPHFPYPLQALSLSSHFQHIHLQHPRIFFLYLFQLFLSASFFRFCMTDFPKNTHKDSNYGQKNTAWRIFRIYGRKHPAHA